MYICHIVDEKRGQQTIELGPFRGGKKLDLSVEEARQLLRILEERLEDAERDE